MKNLLILLSVCMLFLLGIQTTTHADTASSEETVSVWIQPDEVVTDAVFPVDWDYPFGGEIYADAQSLARQISTAGRSLRMQASSKFLFFKALSRAATMHLTLQNHVSIPTHTTSPFLNWEVASEHYIFGMRRILI